jgi:putative ABC transport system permease protein
VRAIVAASGIAMSTLMVLVLMGVYRALTTGVRSYVGPEQIDLWVAPLGTDNLIRSSALLPASIVDSIGALPGVREAAPLLRGFVAVRAVGGGASAEASAASERAPAINLLSIGYRAPDGLGGPPRIHEGAAPKGTSQVALDRAAAHRLGLEIGDTVSVNNSAFELTGLTSGTNLIATQFAFFDAAAGARTSGFYRRVSFVAVGLRPEAVPSEVALQIADRFPQAAVYTREAFVENNVREVAAGFRPMQLLVSGVGILAAAVLVALLVQAAVEDRRQDISVLLAMGAPAHAVGLGVVAHAAWLVVLGGIAGAVLASALHAVLRWSVPTVEIAPRVHDLALVLPLFIGSGVLAACVPLFRLRRIDPIEAFRP